MAALWQINLTVQDQPEVFVEMLDAASDAETTSMHRDEDDRPWLIMIITMTEPDPAQVQFAIDQACAITGEEVIEHNITKLPDINWLAENRKSFPPLDIGRFWIYGNYVTDPVPHGKTGIKIDAGEAFGSGTHGTTHGCIMMLEKHCPDRPNLKIADIGCGSGILAMAAAKLHPTATIIAVDNDQIAVNVAAENTVMNDVGFIKTACAEGYQHDLVSSHAPYDVILANILPTPLIEMSQDAAAALADGGIIILSGLTESHREKVVTAHEKLGLSLVDSFAYNDWVALVMRKGGK